MGAESRVEAEVGGEAIVGAREMGDFVPWRKGKTKAKRRLAKGRKRCSRSQRSRLCGEASGTPVVRIDNQGVEFNL